MVFVLVMTGCGARTEPPAKGGDYSAPDADAAAEVPTATRLELVPHRAMMRVPAPIGPGVTPTVPFGFHALLHRSDGTTVEVAPTAIFAEGSPLGSFSGSVFTTNASLSGDAWRRAAPVSVRLGDTSDRGCVAVVSTDAPLFLLPFGEDPSPPRHIAISTAAAPKRGEILIEAIIGGEAYASPELASLIRRPRAMAEGDPALGCAPVSVLDRDGDGVPELFLDVAPGTMVCMEVDVRRNDALAEAPLARRLDMHYELRATDTFSSPTIARTSAVFLVPPSCP